MFVDESAFSQRPPIRATWAVRGRTQWLVEPFHGEKLPGIGAVLIRPDGQRRRWLLALHQGSPPRRTAHRSYVFWAPCDALGDAR